ncbi:aldo/keto reductase [Erysipelothrix inopinata]|uniref:Aldo/keto reductase n=1 Tax=Erysipelothrix inopinata TaxID=225084 RepID=A0A7G9RZR4_9FIRM|nr:aldo/keto reductase [Erysipelothrix inopinata]QNN61089.1 aldo/keto reductase [Erysipelothrix inopinata]
MQEYYTLSNGVTIPKVGFGTWQTPSGEVAETSVATALEVGYRHLDTAAIYGNEESVGDAVRKSGIDRSELFITTKLWNDKRTYEEVYEAIQESLNKLQTTYIDLYLIHWPNPVAIRENWEGANAEAWRAIEDAYDKGIIRAIGVSNFRQHHLEALFKTARIKPMVNQIFYNPSDMQLDVVNFNNEHGILTEAYSPLGTGKIFEIAELNDIALRYEKTPAQIVLRWCLQNNILPLPKSVTESRIFENFQVFDFDLNDEDMALISSFAGQASEALNPDETQF